MLIKVLIAIGTFSNCEDKIMVKFSGNGVGSLTTLGKVIDKVE